MPSKEDLKYAVEPLLSREDDPDGGNSIRNSAHQCTSINFSRPIIAFVNSKSGGKKGPAVLESLTRLLGAKQVFDLQHHNPEVVLRQIWDSFSKLQQDGSHNADETISNLKILACGGDGTAVWLLKTVKNLSLTPTPPVAVIPLGTGNQLSRTLGWGKGFMPTDQKVKTHLEKVKRGDARKLDCWRFRMFGQKSIFGSVPKHVVKEVESAAANSENPGDVVMEGFTWNYFSVGVNVEAAYRFHSLRNKHPWLAFARKANQFWYGFYSIYAGWFCGAPPIGANLDLEILTDEGGWKTVELTSDIKALVVLNHHNYGGGKDIWGMRRNKENDAGQNMEEPAPDDGKFEIVGLKNGWHMAMVLMECKHGVRLAQCSSARLKFKTRKPKKKSRCFFHLDGEPWKQTIPSHENSKPLLVEISNGGQSAVITREAFDY
ncbi:hypothetical protein BSKO_12787 [Bryopsis sp. KO-2023]|nr:hypothetical protein BSKO_12787 [Bryopsis sp. KO-2023]